MGSDVSEATMNEKPFEQRQKVKKSKKRPRPDLTSNLTKAKKFKKDKKQHCDNESSSNQEKSPTVEDEEKEGLEDPVFTFKTGDMGEMNTKVKEPVIVFKKVLTPNKHTS